MGLLLLLSEHLIVLIEGLLGELDLKFLIALHLLSNIFYLPHGIGVEGEDKLSQQILIRYLEMLSECEVAAHGFEDFIEELLIINLGYNSLTYSECHVMESEVF